MGLLEDIKTLLPVAETSVYINEIADTPDVTLGLFLSGGRDPIRTMDDHKITQPTFQIRIRDNSYVNAMTRINNIIEALDTITNTTINGTEYIGILQTSDVLTLGKDTKMRSNFSLNFKVQVNK